MEKTHAMRVLDAHGIAYEAKAYDNSGAFHAADEAVVLLGVLASSIYKTLVVVRDGEQRAKPLLVIVPADARLDLRLLARGIGAKKLRMATKREAERLTGMQVGGISALALSRPQVFEILIDEAARTAETIHVSAGVRGVDLALRVDDLACVTKARFVRALRLAC